MPQKPPAITITEVLSGEKDPAWNYARIISLKTRVITLEPCCSKENPCWECQGNG